MTRSPGAISKLSNQRGVDALNQITSHGRTVKHTVSPTQLTDKFNHSHVTGRLNPGFPKEGQFLPRFICQRLAALVWGWNVPPLLWARSPYGFGSCSGDNGSMVVPVSMSTRPGSEESDASIQITNRQISDSMWAAASAIYISLLTPSLYWLLHNGNYWRKSIMRFIWQCAGVFLMVLCSSGECLPQKQNVSHSGCAMYRVIIDSFQDAEIISQLRGEKGFIFKTAIDLLNKQVDITVSPDLEYSFKNFMARNGLRHFVIVEDTRAFSALRSNLKNNKKTHFQNVTRYLSYNKIVNFIRKLTDFHNPFNNNVLAKLEVIGRSYEGRKMYMIKISSNHLKKKPVILLEAGMHSREWAGPPTLLYLAQQLVMNFTENRKMLRDVDFFIIPVSNPDGYQYTRNSNRLWRKTRSKTSLECQGVDANRNFDFHWGVSGTSDDPCSDIYRGPRAFSEVETRNLRNVGLRYKSRLLAFIAVHSYGSYILYPWGFTKTLPQDWNMLDICATLGANAIESFNGTKYTVGSSSRVLYEAAGGSDDWFKGKLGVPFAYTLELPGTAVEAFNLPEWKLKPVAQETFLGFKEMVRCFVFHYKKNKLKIFGREDYEEM